MLRILSTIRNLIAFQVISVCGAQRKFFRSLPNGNSDQKQNEKSHMKAWEQNQSKFIVIPNSIKLISRSYCFFMLVSNKQNRSGFKQAIEAVTNTKESDCMNFLMLILLSSLHNATYVYQHNACQWITANLNMSQLAIGSCGIFAAIHWWKNKQNVLEEYFYNHIYTHTLVW